MSALKKVVDLLWFRERDRKLANELAAEFTALEKRIRELESRSTKDAQDGAMVCPECDGAVEFCAMGHYVPAKSAPPVI